MFAFLKSSVFLVVMCLSLALATATLAMKTTMLTAQVATMTASAGAAAVANRAAIAKAVARTKAKARIRRYIAAIPIVGMGAVGAFETQDYLEWKTDNPDGSMADYSCEVSNASAGVVDEVLQSLPDRFRLSSDLVLSYLPECEGPDDI
jgi:hypothetical protein